MHLVVPLDETGMMIPDSALGIPGPGGRSYTYL